MVGHRRSADARRQPRPRAAPQGVYQCAGEDRWVAIAVVTDDAVARAVRDHRLDARSISARRHRCRAVRLHEQSGRGRARGATHRGRGVPAGVVIAPRDVVHNPQLRHRGLFEMEHHPITGDHELLSRPSGSTVSRRGPDRPSPTLGEHNDEVLRELGLAADAITAARSERHHRGRPGQLVTPSTSPRCDAVSSQAGGSMAGSRRRSRGGTRRRPACPRAGPRDRTRPSRS